jgi:hypothetical protein
MSRSKKGYPTAIYSDVTPCGKASRRLPSGDASGALALRSKTGKMRNEENTPLLEELPFFKHQKRRYSLRCRV